jgi:hypothetical protein
MNQGMQPTQESVLGDGERSTLKVRAQISRPFTRHFAKMTHTSAGRPDTTEAKRPSVT